MRTILFSVISLLVGLATNAYAGGAPPCEYKVVNARMVTLTIHDGEPKATITITLGEMTSVSRFDLPSFDPVSKKIQRVSIKAIQGCRSVYAEMEGGESDSIDRITYAAALDIWDGKSIEAQRKSQRDGTALPNWFCPPTVR